MPKVYLRGKFGYKDDLKADRKRIQNANRITNKNKTCLHAMRKTNHKPKNFKEKIAVWGLITLFRYHKTNTALFYFQEPSHHLHTRD